MAIIKFGPIVVGARGTIAGTIFSANRGGPYARGWSRGANPQSTPQNEHRALLGDIASTWRDLTVAQQDDWDDYADDPPQELTNSLGETFFASGFNWFIRINLNLEAAGAARRVDAPTLVRPPAPIIQSASLRITTSIFQSTIQYTVADPDLSALHTSFARVFNSQGRTTSSGNRAFMLLAVPNIFRAIAFQPEIESAFGEILLGQRAFYSTRIQDAHGQRGPADTITVDAIA